MNTNKKSQWCVVFGNPAPSHPSPENYQKFIGSSVVDKTNKPRVFSLRSEAEKFAKEFAAKYQNRWELKISKYSPRTINKNPYEA